MVNVADFSHYRDHCRQIITLRYLHDHNKIELILPQLFSSSQVSNKSNVGILSIHGLLATPYFLRDINQTLFDRYNYHIEELLLPGHGTRPEDLLNISHISWQSVIQQRLAALYNNYNNKNNINKNFYLLGHSLGGLLALLTAYEACELNSLELENNLRGLILIVPAIKIRYYPRLIINLAKFGGYFTERLRWIERHVEDDFARYQSMALNSAIEVYRLTQKLNYYKNRYQLKLPLLIFAVDNDAVVSCEATEQFFTQQSELNINNLNNKLYIYTSRRENNNINNKNNNIIYLSSFYPQEHILNFSHLSLTFSPDNPHYGRSGDYRYLVNQQAHKKNNNKKNKNNFYGECNDARITHRLLYNPNFNSMIDNIHDFIIHTSQN